jgi:hypothetical protein
MSEGKEAILIITNDAYNPLLIDDIENFNKVFEVVKNHVVLKKVEWHPMSGGFDTWCQSYSVGHVRSGTEFGKQLEPFKIMNIYFFDSRS